MYHLKPTNIFKRDLKRSKKRGKSIDKLHNVLILLQNGEILPESYRDHSLTGNWVGRRECHIEPDWLLIYAVFDVEIVLERLGIYADLFR